MANPGSIGIYDNTLQNGTLCAVILASTIQSSVTLNPNQIYSFAHDGEDPSGNSATQTIYMCTSGTVVTSPDSGLDKIKLMFGRPMSIGPNFKTLNFATLSGIALFSVIPGGTVN